MKAKDIYNDRELIIMKKSFEINYNKAFDRIDEIIAFAKNNNITKLGIAKCSELTKEAVKLENILIKEGFNVFMVDCNYGKENIEDLKMDYQYITCNPAGQAKFLEDKGTELNIVVGLCVGHDMIFNMKSKAPVTTLFVKDRKFKHNTLKRFDNYNQQ